MIQQLCNFSRICFTNLGADMKDAPILWIVIPCYNEEDVLPVAGDMFLKKIISLEDNKLISEESKILFVNDGSSDTTWDLIKDLSGKDRHFKGISLSRNFGHQRALLAGLMEAMNRSDITISIDCDGQDDVDAMDEMIRRFAEGYDIVYGVRKKRDTDSFFKRFTAESFYRFMHGMGTEVVFNHADYRLISKRALEAFSDFKEVNLFLRGLIPLVGFKSATVFYDRKERMAGVSHYPLKKMCGLAFDGITSLSVKPIRYVTIFGFLIAFISFIGVMWAVIQALRGETVSGWASMTSIICFVSGCQMFSLGLIGEYVGKIYMESKKRPRYIISERIE